MTQSPKDPYTPDSEPKLASRPAGSETTAPAVGRESAVHRALQPEARLSAAVQAPIVSPSPREVLDALSALTRGIEPESGEHELLRRLIDALQHLFPGRNLLLYLLQPAQRGTDTHGEVHLVHQSLPLLPGREQRLELTGIQDRPRLPPAFEVVSEYVPFFSEGARGFSLPILDNRTVTGVLSVEYAKNAQPPEDDEFYVQRLVHQISAFLHNTRVLRESRYLRDYLETLLDHASAPIVAIGANRTVQVANQAFLALTGLGRDDLLGRDFADLIPEQERHRLLPVFFRALRGEDTIDVDLTLPRSDGSQARVVLNTASVVGATGQVESVIAIGRDLTKLKELEEQVIQAEKLATLGQLAAGVVHELNNPLTSISVYSDFLLKKARTRADDPKDVEKLERIVGSAERILRFTRDLVTYARPNREEPNAVSMSQALDQSLVFCEHLIQETGARIDKEYADAVPALFATKSQLHQVFINLITNACHAMPVGAGVLTIALREGPGETVCVRLEDNGCGIPQSQLDHVFEPFFSTKGEGKGTGLGLSIVRNIVQQLGGDIEVESIVGQGTVFEIQFPLTVPR